MSRKKAKTSGGCLRTDSKYRSARCAEVLAGCGIAVDEKKQIKTRTQR